MKKKVEKQFGEGRFRGSGGFRGSSGIIIACAMILLHLFTGVAFALESEGVPSSVQSPLALANWLSAEFSFRMEYPDKWQSPEETIRSKKGDCEDFAILTSAVLTKLGIHNDILIIKFKDLKISHAVCIWKDKDGYYSFMSNNKLYRTKKDTIEQAVGKYYPDWESISPLQSK